jgi:hypothetical protein
MSHSSYALEGCSQERKVGNHFSKATRNILKFCKCNYSKGLVTSDFLEKDKSD